MRDRMRDMREEHDWEHRRGRFADCDPDTPDRPQIRPGRRPADPRDETHGFGGDGIRIGEGGDNGA